MDSTSNQAQKKKVGKPSTAAAGGSSSAEKKSSFDNAYALYSKSFSNNGGNKPKSRLQNILAQQDSMK